MALLPFAPSVSNFFKKTGGTITPSADSTTAVLITNAANNKNVLDVDTTNTRLGIGTNAPADYLHINFTPTSRTEMMRIGVNNTDSGAFVVVSNTNNEGDTFFGFFDGPNNIYFGISNSLPGNSYNNKSVSTLGGYYKGLGIGGGSNTTDPIFGILNSSQGGNGIGQVAFTIYADNRVFTYNSKLDDGSGNMEIKGKANHYNNIATTGWGIPAIYGMGRSTAQTGSVASVAAYTVGAADGSFIVSANVNVTTSTTHNFTVTVAYTDETNTARTLTLSFTLVAGTYVSAIVNTDATHVYMGIPQHIRCKASTSITIATTGTFTTVTYNVEGMITQIA